LADSLSASNPNPHIICDWSRVPLGARTPAATHHARPRSAQTRRWRARTSLTFC